MLSTKRKWNRNEKNGSTNFKHLHSVPDYLKEPNVDLSDSEIYRRAKLAYLGYGTTGTKNQKDHSRKGEERKREE